MNSFQEVQGNTPSKNVAPQIDLKKQTLNSNTAPQLGQKIELELGNGEKVLVSTGFFKLDENELQKTMAYLKEAVKMVVPKEVAQLPEGFFRKCENLKDVLLAGNQDLISSKRFYIDSDGYNYFCNTSPFFKCKGIESLIIQEGIQRISDGQFEDCINLKRVVLPTSVKKIGVFAFKDCESLERIEIPRNVSIISKCAFIRCKNLTEVILSPSVKIIDDGAFLGCESLEKIIIPEGVEKIGMDAFERCKKLKEIQLPSTLTKLEMGAFADCESLERVVIPDKIKQIPIALFQGCKNLKEVIYKGRNIIHDIKPRGTTSLFHMA